MGKLWKSAVIGGVIVFVWSAISHMVGPWHEANYHRFSGNEDEVANVLKSHTSESGMYIYPMGTDPGPNPTSEQEAQREEEVWAKMAQGPMAVVFYTKEGMSSMAAPMITGFIIVLLIAATISWLLLKTTGLSYWSSVIFLMVAGAVGSAEVRLQYWNWWGFPLQMMLTEIIDTAFAWFLAGMAMVRWGGLQKG